MVDWHNWSGRVTATPEQIVFIRSEEDAVALVERARRQGTEIRVAGATHSHAPLVATRGLVADPQGMSGVIETNPNDQTAWVWAGTRIHSLGLPLRTAGLALKNQGDIDQQAIAGAVATGTHGTGQSLKNLSASVVGMTVATGGGELVSSTETQNPDLLRAARLNLGGFGIVTRLKLALRSAYVLQEVTWQSSLDEILEQAEERIARHRHFEFFWYPTRDLAQAKAIDETDEPPSYPLADEGARRAWSHEVLPNHRPHKHTEMEYSVPLANGPACLRAIRDLLRSDFPEVAWPVEYRTLAADDVWLSTAYERETITISVHQDVAIDETEYYRACEQIFLEHEGRPHWGKVHYLSGARLAGRHPRWQDWWTARDRFDPQAIFLNDYLKGLRDD